MLSVLLFAVLGAPPVCDEQVHFRWPSSSFVGQRGAALAMRTFAWVRDGGDAFVLELAGQETVLVGRRVGGPLVADVVGWKKE